MILVVKYVNKIRALELNRREFRKYCELLDMEYGDLILHCKVCWLSRGQALRRSWKPKSILQDFLEEKDELPKENNISCDKN